MNIYKYKNNLKKILFYVTILLLIVIYLVLLFDTSFSSFIIKSINKKYTFNKINFKDELMYSSLNKVIKKEDIKQISSMKIIDIKEEIIYEEEIKSNELNNPLVYIYTTHEGEKYHLPFVSDYSITPDVKLASYILKDYLNDYNIESFVQTKSTLEYIKKKKLTYPHTYDASREFLKEELKKNEYKILIDLHRDSVKKKFTTYEKDKKKYAKIMFVLTTKHKNYKQNEKFASILNDKINKSYKGLSRGILKRNDVIFNQDLSPNAILIELGGVDNTIEEVNNTLSILAKIIYEYIKEENL